MPRRVVVLRFAVLRGFAAALLDALAAPLLARFAVERLAGDLRVADAVLAAPADFARVDRLAVDLRAPVERLAAVLRAGLAAPPALDEVDADPSMFHFPDITRCAASATASAMIEPSLVALDTLLLAACDAVSAASRPASRIFLRAAGLAAIAAAAAVNPAASISLLIAALASLSTVLEPELEPVLAFGEDELEREREELEREEALRVGFAIVYLPASTKRHFTAVPVP